MYLQYYNHVRIASTRSNVPNICRRGLALSHLAPASSQATEHSGSKAPGFQIRTRDHLRIDTVTEIAR